MESAYPLGTFVKRIYAGQITTFALTHPVRITSVAVTELPDGNGGEFTPSALRLHCSTFPGSRDIDEDSDEDDEDEDDEDEDDEDEDDEEDEEDAEEDEEDAEELEEDLEELEDAEDDEEGSEEEISSDDDLSEEDTEIVTLAWLTSKQLHTTLDTFLPDGEALAFSIDGDEDLVVDVSGHYIMLPGAESESEFDSDDDDDEDEYDLEPDSDEELDMEDDDLSGPNKAYMKLLKDSSTLDPEDDEDDDDDDEEEEDEEEEDEEEPVPALVKATSSKKRGAEEAGIDADADMSSASKSGPTEEGLIQLALQAGIPEADVRDMSRNQRKRLAKKIKTSASAGADEDVDEIDGATAKAEKKAAAAAAAAITKAVKATAAPAEKKKAESAKPSKTTTTSGLTIQTMNAPSGTSRTAKAGDRVGMRYVGKLLSTGAQFDANTKGKPFSFKLGKGEVIKGWDEGVKGMRIGEERRLTCPPHLAYGRQKLPGIPANSTLVFDIKLVEIK